MKTPQQMLKIISEITGQSVEDIVSKSHKQEHFFARMMFAKLYHNKMSLSAIGYFINRDHATVLNSINKFEYEYKYNVDFRDKFDKVKQLSDFIIDEKNIYIKYSNGFDCVFV